jgi:hypothetical protein
MVRSQFIDIGPLRPFDRGDFVPNQKPGPVASPSKKTDRVIGAVLFVAGLAFVAAALGMGFVRHWTSDSLVMGILVGAVGLLFIGIAGYFVFSPPCRGYLKDA